MGDVFVIAEAGVNHNGDVRSAMEMIDAAVDAGADAVKFQTFKAEALVDSAAPKADYQKAATDSAESQLTMLKGLELSHDDFGRLYQHCNERGIEFISTPFDLESVEFLHTLGMRIWKVPSGEVTNLPLLKKIAGYSRQVVVSTGMCSLGDVEACLNVLFEAGVQREQVTLLHCTTDYPTPLAEVNLLAMRTLADSFKLPVGYSDHTMGIEVSVAAAAMGASIIEKHFTLDSRLPGPDQNASLNPDELSEMITAIRNVSIALGDGIKKIGRAEAKNIAVVRKSIMASRPIKKGDLFTEENLTVKRPGTGLSPMMWDDLLGGKAGRDYERGEAIDSL